MAAGKSNADGSNRTIPRHGLQSAARAVSRAGRPLWRKRGFAEARIITDWKAIVGETLAPYSLPLRVSAPREPGAPQTLLIRVAGSWAVEVHHLSPQIIERVNSFLGFAAVGEIRIEQGPVVAPPRRPRPKVVPEAEKQAVADVTDGVEDEGLRSALRGLGEAMHGRPAGRPRA